MKITHLLLALALVALTSCSTAKTPTKTTTKTPKATDSPETMLLTYHVQPGSEDQLQQTLSQAWEIYRQHHLVLAQPHVIFQAKEIGGKTRFVEIFTWVNHAAPETAPEAVKKIWDRMQSLCEARDGHVGLEGVEVELMVPKL
jgi:hypothetical protein